ncbi:uncharacterized protein V6R79_021992 [Siganus canaliculatus]
MMERKLRSAARHHHQHSNVSCCRRRRCKETCDASTSRSSRAREIKRNEPKHRLTVVAPRRDVSGDTPPQHGHAPSAGTRPLSTGAEPGPVSRTGVWTLVFSGRGIRPRWIMLVNASQGPAHASVNSSLLFLADSCYASVYVSSSYGVAFVLLLPLFIFVLLLGARQRGKRRGPPLHLDVLTFHSVALQLNEAVGVAAFFSGLHAGVLPLRLLGLAVYTVAVKGQALFHLLTCVDRYLAVVHPLTYRELRREGGAWIRDASVGGAWILSCVWLVLYFSGGAALNAVVYFTVVGGLLAAILFCNISVLRVLRRPGPGSGGRVDKSKRRAFHTMLAIMASLLVAFGGSMAVSGVHVSAMFPDSCVADVCQLVLDLPCRLVLPLLFLHRAKKLQLRCHERSIDLQKKESK